METTYTTYVMFCVAMQALTTLHGQDCMSLYIDTLRNNTAWCSTKAIENAKNCGHPKAYITPSPLYTAPISTITAHVLDV